MPFILFHDFFPEVAGKETRTATVLNNPDGKLPSGDYGFLEMYCDEADCDCRRVYFDVISRGSAQTEAFITWGWENEEFYRSRSKLDLSPEDLAELIGPALATGQPQGKLAPALLDFVRDIILADAAYVERIKRHYKMFRERIENPVKTEWWRKKKKWR